MLPSAWSWRRAAILVPTRRARRSRGWTAPPPILTCRSFMLARGATAPAFSPMEVACWASPHAGATSKRRNRALTLPLTRSAGRKAFRAATSAGALCREGKLQLVRVRSRHGQLVALAFRPGGVACRMTFGCRRPDLDPPTGSEEFMVIRKSDYRLWALAALALLAAGSMMAGLAWSEPASDSNSDLYSQLNLFGEVLSRVRSDYVEKPDDQKLVEDAIRGMLMALDLSHRQRIPRHAGADQGRVRWARHRSHHGERHDQGRLSDRGHAGGQGWPAERRPHYRTRQRIDRRTHPRGGRGEDARPGQRADHPHHHA